MVESTPALRILCVDDSPALRDGLRALITLESDLEWVGAAADGEEGIRLTESLQPDVVVLDVDMPGLSGLEVARRIRVRRPQTRIVVFTGEKTWQAQALAAGADAFVLKDAPAGELFEAIRNLPASPATAAAPNAQTVLIVVEPITTFDIFMRMARALETLDGLRAVRPHRFQEAKLEIMAEDAGSTPLLERLRIWQELGAFAAVEDAPDGVIIRLR